MRDSLFTFIMRSAVLPVAIGSVRDQIGTSFTRFKPHDSLGPQSVLFDEPFALLSAANWFDRRLETTHTDLHGRREAFEDYLALYLSHALDSTTPLKEIFNFIETPPPWATLPANLVALSTPCSGTQCIWHPIEHSESESDSTSHPTNTPTPAVWAIRAKSAFETLEWLRDPRRVPFCSFELHSGSGIAFFVRLFDGVLLLVVVEAHIQIWSLTKGGDVAASAAAAAAKVLELPCTPSARLPN
ncbi:hypothetical protein BOTBODRAFT_596130 [Botryobasidium botryosum FD-172 SS1]|uniref:Uncharacterized protein n=1 Tax=Botryobasidium botryosum (strain FD-172 SS1) TaxID=930990 RepID=A0A067M762_BOTB1|nr:hypothetical protein BOTBODRAFT_596130 [Botryobasidium botryosum FD-172 SS1]